MGKVAEILLEFDPSPSENVDRSEITCESAGSVSKFTVGKDARHITVKAKAPSTLVVTAKTFDTDGDVTDSVVFTYIVGDGVGPIPISNFRATVVGYTDEPDEEPLPVEPAAFRSSR